MMKCTNLSKFLQTEIEIIEKHIDKHKWFNHIENKDEAIADFILKFGWLMRDYYCRFICPHFNECFMNSKNSNGENNDYEI